MIPTSLWSDSGLSLSSVQSLSLADISRLKTARDRVLALICDGQWHPARQITSPEIGGSEGLRRYREIRQALSPYGWAFSKRRITEGRGSWEYKARGPDLFLPIPKPCEDMTP